MAALRLASASSPERRVFRQKTFLCQGKKKQNGPQRFRAHMLADRKSHSPEVAPSGVRHDMFVAFMTCFRCARGSLSDLEVNASKKIHQDQVSK
jgi:hypothetical protein